MKKNKKLAVLLSVLFMGLGQIYSGFYLKGVVLSVIEILTIMNIKNIIPIMNKFYTLGTQVSQLIGFDYIQGDDSLIILFNGITVIILLFFFTLFYIYNISDAGKCTDYVNKKGKSPGTLLYIKEYYNRNFALLVLLPAAIGALLFVILPIILTALVSFTNYSGPDHLPPKNLFQWVGLSNYFKLIQLKAWRTTFIGVGLWTLCFALATTFLNFTIGLFLAILTNMKGIKFNLIWKGIFILPHSVPVFVSLLAFRLILTPSGPLNNALNTSIPFLTDPLLAKFIILAVGTWAGAPYFMVLLSGTLTNIQGTLYEAAQIDGAGIFQRFFKITLPIVLYQTIPVLIITFAYNLNNFGTIYFLTNGWPPNSNYRYAGSTDLLLTWIYKMTTDQGQYALASVITMIIFSFVASISLMMFLKTKSFKQEGILS